MNSLLYQRWIDTFMEAKIFVDWEEMDKFKLPFEKVCSKYQDSKRFYHNLEHIDKLLFWAYDLKSQIKDYSTVRFAIWFHDVIYNPQSVDNEEKSALKAKKVLSHFPISITQIEKIAYYIRCTKNHTEIKSEDSDLLLFLDLDLSILGSSRKFYVQYAKNIQKEYNFVPHLTYNQKRKEFLEKMLAAPTIYKTPQAQSLFETKARENIRYEIEFCL